MNSVKEKISRSTWTLFQSAKDTLIANITKAVKDSQLKISQEELQKLLNLISSSADEGYHKGHKNFMVNLDNVIKVMYPSSGGSYINKIKNKQV